MGFGNWNEKYKWGYFGHFIGVFNGQLTGMSKMDTKVDKRSKYVNLCVPKFKYDGTLGIKIQMTLYIFSLITLKHARTNSVKYKIIIFSGKLRSVSEN